MVGKKQMSKKVGEQPRQADFFNLCENCPKCCCIEARPPVSSKRETKINNYVKASGLAIENAFEKKNGYTFPRETEGNLCLFLDKNTRKCRIHPVKPETCVAGPITFDINLRTGKIEWFLKTAKICPLAGTLCRNRSELQGHLESARRELLTLVRDLDADALHAILKIEEPDTFKIGEEVLHDHDFKTKRSATAALERRNR
jgi:Fe-S-cluster containining protein